MGRYGSAEVRYRSHSAAGSNQPMSVALFGLNFSEFFVGKDYWYAIVSAFIGAMLGIGYTRWDLKRQRRKEQMLCVKRLRECLSFNVDRLNQASDLLQQGKIPNYPLDTGQLNYWLTQSHDILEHDLFASLDWQRY